MEAFSSLPFHVVLGRAQIWHFLQRVIKIIAGSVPSHAQAPDQALLLWVT